MGAVLLAVLPLPPTAVSVALEVSAGCADFAALGGAAALYGCCACLSVLGVSVWAQLRLFAGAAFRPRLLVFSRAVHLVLLQLLVRVCAQLLPGQRYGMQYAGRPRPSGFPSASGRRGGGVCLSLRSSLQGPAKSL